MLAIEDIGIGFGGVTALADVSFNVEAGEIFAIIGPNGAGKTTLFNVISGLYPPRAGPRAAQRRGRHRPAAASAGAARPVAHVPEPADLLPHERGRERHGRPPLHERRNVLAHLFTLPSVLRAERASRAPRPRICSPSSA